MHTRGSTTHRAVICTLALATIGGTIKLGTAAGLPTADPEAVGMSAARLAEIDRVVAQGLDAGQMPGCVVLIARGGRIAFLKAYGNRWVDPERRPMTTDTVFDLASLTKPIATASSIMLLCQQGRLRLDDRVSRHLGEFAGGGKEAITVYQLLTHQGGLTPDNHLDDYADGPRKAWERICGLGLRASPGSRFIYSDVGYIVLGELVRRLTGEDLRAFTRREVFAPLGMNETGFLPDERLRRRAAPTEQREGRWLAGEVHDPRAAALGGVAGHAGLFSTAKDLAVFAQMLLGGGRYGQTRIFQSETVATMTAGYPVPGGLRGLGWDVRSGYSTNRGKSFSPRAFGHGGFTGTSLWIDPKLNLVVIFLSNRLHPDGKGSVNRLAGSIGTIAADAIVPRPARGRTRTGIDVLAGNGFAQLAGRRVGLITNQTGISRDGTSTIRLLAEAKNVELKAIFSPEHGLEGKLDVPRIGDSKEASTGLPVWSLYGKTRRPTAESLRGLDTLVFDIQDIGTRFYTYISTLGEAMRVAAEHGLRFVVLDRPNPIGGVEVAGPVLDPGRESFVGFHRLPIRHGMTVGELAGMFNEELRIGVDLEVVRMESWRRRDLFEATGLRWVNPSPNMRSPTEALLYPGVGLLETTNVSVGRGTEIPFEVVGAPWLDGGKLARRLNRAGLEGVRFTPITFTPQASKWKGEVCGGIRIHLTDACRFRPVRTGIEIARALRSIHRDDWNAKAYDRLLCDRQVYEAVLEVRPVAEIEALWAAERERFLVRRARFLLYP